MIPGKFGEESVYNITDRITLSDTVDIRSVVAGLQVVITQKLANSIFSKLVLAHFAKVRQHVHFANVQ